MNSAYSRTDRLSGTILRKLAEIIRIEIKDPRLPRLITISKVDVSRDLSHAKVYFTAYSGEHAKTTEILNSAASYLRSALARTVTTRTVPQLHFIYDDSIEYGEKLSKLIDDVNQSNQSVQSDINPNSDVDN